MWLFIYLTVSKVYLDTRTKRIYLLMRCGMELQRNSEIF